MNPKISSTGAFTGLEAAIVLIAFVTVASVFSYVILGAGFTTTQKSQEVIYQSMGQVSSVMMLTGDVYGISTDGTALDTVNFTFRLSAGGGSVNFETVTITISDANHLETLSPVTGWKGSSTTPGTWAVIQVDNEQGNPNNVLEPGEQFTISVHPDFPLPARDRFVIDITPAGGAATGLERTVPGQVTPVTRLY